MDECLLAIRGLWTGDYFGFDGEFIKFGEVKMRPVPKVPVPILVGGHSKPALRRAAKLGDGWMSAGGTVEENTAMVEDHPGLPQGIRDRRQAVPDPCRGDGFDRH